MFWIIFLMINDKYLSCKLHKQRFKTIIIYVKTYKI